MKSTILVLIFLLMNGCKSNPVFVKPVAIEYSKAAISEIDENKKKKA